MLGATIERKVRTGACPIYLLLTFDTEAGRGPRIIGKVFCGGCWGNEVIIGAIPNDIMAMVVSPVAKKKPRSKG